MIAYSLKTPARILTTALAEPTRAHWRRVAANPGGARHYRHDPHQLVAARPRRTPPLPRPNAPPLPGALPDEAVLVAR